MEELFYVKRNSIDEVSTNILISGWQEHRLSDTVAVYPINGWMETFFKTLKTELVYRSTTVLEKMPDTAYSNTSRVFTTVNGSIQLQATNHPLNF